MNREPSFKKMLTNDSMVLFSLVSPLALWAFFFVVYFFEDPGIASTGVPSTFAVLTVLAAAVLVWRVKRIGTIFEQGFEVQGTITRVWFYRGRGTIRYEYTLQGQAYKSGNTVNRTRQTREIAVGQPVTLIVDPDHPKRALIRDLYL